MKNKDRVIQKIKYFLNGTVIERYKGEVNERNDDYLKSFAVVGLITTCFTVLFGQIMRHVVTFNTEFFIIFLYFLAMLAWAFLGKKRTACLTMVLYIWMTPLMFVGILLGTFLDPLEPSITIMVFLCVLPLFILDKPWRIILFITISAAVYVLCCFFAKTYELFVADMIDLVLFYFLSQGINCLILRDRLRNVEYAATMCRVSETDELTVLYNRRAGEQRVSELLEQGQSGLFCMLDVDDFKKINDQYGHVAGDFVLKAVAGQLRACSGPHDIVMRIGGDEFGIYAAGIADSESGTAYAQRLFQAVDTLVVDTDPDYKVRISLGGVYFFAENPKDFAALYHQSDIALYQAKRSGKGQFCIY